jgi:hypothetical protein
MSRLDLVLLRGEPKGAVQYIAIQDRNLVFEGPLPFAKEAQILETLDQLEKCLVDSADRPAESALKKLGQDLAEALFPGDIRGLARVEAGEPLQLGVCCVDPDLKRIPWEYVVWPGDKRAPSGNKSIARIVPVADSADGSDIPRRDRKLRVALIVASPAEMASLPWEQLELELKRTFETYLTLKEAANQIELVTIGNVTRGALFERLRREHFDIIHFIGHAESNGLYMHNRIDRKAELVTTAGVVGLFAVPKVQLILLSACSTGKIPKGGGIAPLAEELVLNNVPAVVASQLPIPASIIAVFCAALYQRLLESGDIDEAVAEGRMRLQAELSHTVGGALIEWGIPVLYRRPGHSKLFR